MSSMRLNESRGVLKRYKVSNQKNYRILAVVFKANPPRFNEGGKPKVENAIMTAWS